MQPLRGSEVLEKLDLGMSHQFINPTAVDDSTSLSAPIVLDVLESILEVPDDNCFQRLQLPRDWMTDRCPTKGQTWCCNNSAIQTFNSRFGGIFNPKTLNTYFGFGDSEDLVYYLRDAPLDDGSDSYENADPLNGCAFCEFYDQCSVCDHCGLIGCSGCGDHPYQCVNCGINCCDGCAEEIANPVSYCGVEDCESMCKECRLKSFTNGTGYDCRGCKYLAFDDLLFQNSQQQSIIDQLRIEKQQLRSGKGD